VFLHRRVACISVLARYYIGTRPVNRKCVLARSTEAVALLLRRATARLPVTLIETG
jgi:hypothetical protein